VGDKGEEVGTLWRPARGSLDPNLLRDGLGGSLEGIKLTSIKKLSFGKFTGDQKNRLKEGQGIQRIEQGRGKTWPLFCLGEKGHEWSNKSGSGCILCFVSRQEEGRGTTEGLGEFQKRGGETEA